MRRSVIPVLSLLSLLSLSSVGCILVPTAESVRWEIERRVPEARFELEEHVTLGRISLGLLRTLVRMAPGKVDGQEFLTSIRRIETATYRVVSLPDLDRFEDTHFESELTRAGWSLAVRAREQDSRMWLFLRTSGDGVVNNLFVVDLDQDELTVVRLDGRLDRALAEAVAHDPDEVIRQVGG